MYWGGGGRWGAGGGGGGGLGGQRETRQQADIKGTVQQGQKHTDEISCMMEQNGTGGVKPPPPPPPPPPHPAPITPRGGSSTSCASQSTLNGMKEQQAGKGRQAIRQTGDTTLL